MQWKDNNNIFKYTDVANIYIPCESDNPTVNLIGWLLFLFPVCRREI